MQNITERIINLGFSDKVLTDIDIGNAFAGTKASRYGLLNKAFKNGELIRVRRGLYLLSAKYRHKKLSKFFLASRILPHSYVSLESALSYHGWIPEKVVSVSSVTQNRSRRYATPSGEFVYYHIPINEFEFLTEVMRHEEVDGEPFLMASPLQALADYVFVKKTKWQGLSFLTQSLRIEIENLNAVKVEEFARIKNVYRTKYVLTFLNKLQTELKK